MSGEASEATSALSGPPELEEALLPAGALAGGAAAGDSWALPAAREGKSLLAIGGPMVAEELLGYGSTILAILFCGRLGAFALGAFTLSHAVTNISGIALLNGVTGAMDTFGSQAHGSRAYPAIGISLQRALLVSLLTCIPLVLLYWQAGPVLLALGQEQRLAAAAARYTIIFSPKIVLHAVVLCLYRTLASQGAALYVLAAGTVYFLVTAPLNWLFIWGLGWGLDGSAAAAVACEVVYVAALACLCALHNARRPPEERWWAGWCGEALHDWGPFLRLSAATTAMTILDWWAYDILTLLAGLLPSGDVGVAATGIVYNIQTIVFMLPFGLSYAVCARVGHHLGAAKPRAAKLAAEVGTALGMVLAGLPALLLLLGRDRAAALFTGDATVIQTCSQLMLPLALLMLTNGATALLSGTLRGSGRQKIGAWVNGAANYVVGLPLELLLAFKLRMGVAGLWWGIAAAATLQAGVLAVFVSRFDWRHEAVRAGKLVRHLSKSSLAASAGPSQQQEWQQGQERPVLQPVMEERRLAGAQPGMPPLL